MREYFCAWHSMLGSMRKLSDAECGRLFRALLKYSSGEQPNNLQGREELLFDVFAQQIDREIKAYKNLCETNKQNGSKANTKKRHRTVADGTERHRTVADGTQDKEEYKDKDKDDVPPTPFGDDGGDDLLQIGETLNAAFDAAEGIGLKGGAAVERANRLAADYSADWLLEAIRRTASAPSSCWGWRYIEAILRRWKQQGGIDAEKKPEQPAKPKTRKERYNCVVNGEVMEYEREVPV